jgi:hypothetical protein
LRNFYLLVLLTTLSLPTLSQAQDIYVAQDLAGAGNGSNCDNAYSAAWFNTARNWGNARMNRGARIEPGTTVHLCGVITSTLIAQGSGTPGLPITILFEKDAKLSQSVCPATTGCLSMNRRADIILDGGTNGVIEGTDNGTVLGNRSPSVGVSAYPCTNCEIKHLTIQNIYVHAFDPTDTTLVGNRTNLIKISGGNITIRDNILHDAGWAIYHVYGNGDTNVAIHHNDIYNIDHGWAVAGQGAIAAAKFKFYDNHIHDYGNWDSNTGVYHHDGVHAFGTNGAVGDQYDIYNNLFDGDCGKNITGHIYLESNVKTRWSVTGVARIFNNVFKCTTDVFGLLNIGSGVVQVYNNTIIGEKNSMCLTTGQGLTVSIINNAMSGCKFMVNLSSDTNFSDSARADLNYNTYASNAIQPWHWKDVSPMTKSFDKWKGSCDCDAHSTHHMGLLLNNDGSPKPKSPVIRAGKNLTRLAIEELNRDKARVPRPSFEAWSTGAFEVTNRLEMDVTPPSPTNLTLQ